MCLKQAHIVILFSLSLRPSCPPFHIACQRMQQLFQTIEKNYYLAEGSVRVIWKVFLAIYINPNLLTLMKPNGYY